eukprot:4051036-Pyramimonas_sp.AAC.1
MPRAESGGAQVLRLSVALAVDLIAGRGAARNDSGAQAHDSRTPVGRGLENKTSPVPGKFEVS